MSDIRESSNIDVIRAAIQFPLLNKGDHVVISRIGAYNMTQWCEQFITFRPNVLLIDNDGNTHIIRENETKKTFEQLERVPDYLK